MKAFRIALLVFCAISPFLDAAENVPASARGNAKSATGKSVPASKTPSKTPVKTLGSSITDWGDSVRLEKSVKSKISRAFKEWNAAEVEEFLSKEENRILLTRAEFLRLVPPKTVTLFMKKSALRKTMQAFLTDPEWLGDYLYTGTVKNPELFLNLLCAIAQTDSQVNEPGVPRNLATAVAAEFARNNWMKGGEERVLRRYKFFADSWRAGTLNVLFDDYDVWDLRIVGGCKGEDNWGGEDSLKWLRENVSLPEKAYRTHVYQVPYRLHNKVGDLIHNQEYFLPFSGYFNGNPAPFSLEIGGVCGAVSHFAAFAACANGIPAITMGEPGHCAFSVRVQGKWYDGNSVSWDRGCHWAIWHQHREWVYLHLSEQLYGNKKETRQSFREAELARIAAQAKSPDAALEIFARALKTQPLNLPVWEEFFALAKTVRGNDAAFWRKQNVAVVDALAAEFPEAAAQLLIDFVYPNYIPAMDNPNEIFQEYKVILEKFSSWKPAQWNTDLLWDYQNSNAKNSGTYKSLALATLKNTPQYSKDFTAWRDGTKKKKED